MAPIPGNNREEPKEDESSNDITNIDIPHTIVNAESSDSDNQGDEDDNSGYAGYQVGIMLQKHLLVSHQADDLITAIPYTQFCTNLMF